MANYSRWDDIKKSRGKRSSETRAAISENLDLGQLIYDMRTEARLSKPQLVERMGTTRR